MTNCYIFTGMGREGQCPPPDPVLSGGNHADLTGDGVQNFTMYMRQYQFHLCKM